MSISNQNLIGMMNCNTLGVVDYRRPTLLVCETLDQLLSYLSDLASALKMLMTERGNLIMREDDAAHNPFIAAAEGLRERKSVNNLPDLLQDLPISHTTQSTMTLCNARPSVLPERCANNSRVLRQNSNTKRRREHRQFPTTMSNNDAITTTARRPHDREGTHTRDNRHYYHHGGNAYISGHNNAINNNNNYNRVRSNDYDANINNHEHGYVCPDIIDNADMANGNIRFSYFEYELAMNDFNRDTVNRDVSNNNHHNNNNNDNTYATQRSSNMNSFRNTHSYSSQACKASNHGNGSTSRQHQAETSVSSDHLDCACAEEHGTRQSAQGSGENSDNNSQLAVSRPAPAEQDPHPEFTKELVRALRNIGDNLDTKLRDQDQPGVPAVLGSTKINIGKLLVTALRHHNIIGVALGASLEVYLLYKRL